MSGRAIEWPHPRGQGRAFIGNLQMLYSFTHGFYFILSYSYSILFISITILFENVGFIDKG